ncbi:MAG TPA: zinc ribbon domain-containing protein [Bryobacteraceae bacterium]|jgi:hypothetical protein
MSNYQHQVSEPWNEKMRLIRFRMKKEKLRFRDEIRLIPRGLAVAVVVLFVLAQALMQVVNYYEGVAPPEFTGAAAQWVIAAMVTGVSIPIAAIIFLIGYVARDAARRGMNPTLWVVLVIILLPAWAFVGFVIYFLVREPLPYHCTQCGSMVSARFNYCPHCKYNLRPACAHCQREVGEFDRYCPHCGATVAQPAQPEPAG